MSAFDVLHPERLPWLLLAPAVWAFLCWRAHCRARRLERAVGLRLLVVADGIRPARGRVRRLLFMFAVLFAVVAALEPRYGHARVETTWQGLDLVVALDVSRSMYATDLAPNRLDAAKASLRALAAHAASDRLALVLFAGEARLISPLTQDRPSWTQLAEEAQPSSVPLGGTDLGSALDLALRALAGAGSRPSAIVLLTDGEDFGARGLRVAKRCRAEGVPVHCVGLGTRRGSKIPLATTTGARFLQDRSGRDVVSAMKPESLRAIAAAGGGAFVQASTSDTALIDLYAQELLPRAQLVASSAPASQKQSRFQWPLLLALLLWFADRALGTGRRS